MGHARIGRIRMKNGGAEVRLIRQVTEDRGAAENWRGLLVSQARAIAETEGRLCGYLLIGIYEDGGHQCGFRINDDASPIPRTLLPAYVEEIVRRYAVTKAQVGATIDELNGVA